MENNLDCISATLQNAPPSGSRLQVVLERERIETGILLSPSDPMIPPRGYYAIEIFPTLVTCSTMKVDLPLSFRTILRYLMLFSIAHL